jgi:hypothetical protein
LREELMHEKMNALLAGMHKADPPPDR